MGGLPMDKEEVVSKKIIKSFYLVSVQMKFLEGTLGFIKKNFIV